MASSRKKRLIEHFIVDVDGVFTNGQFIYSEKGKYAKIFGPHDHDGIKLLKKYINIQAITADKKGLPITQKRIEEDMKIPLKLINEEARLKWLKENFDLQKTIYMGDGMYDSKIFHYVKYSIAPNNSFYLAKEKADFVTYHNAGEGAVAEACLHILKKFFRKEAKNLL
ncbi:HAD hydrolase family protein [Candidatus Peregrinibacteria bacterium]|nr:HAD hydrolase family protein [Candidatus Peregrinibacteria bacterium]